MNPSPTRKVSRKAPQQTRDELGRRLCRMPSCGKLVGKGRRSYCSDKCARAFEVAYFPGVTRALVHKRDRGVCALCKCDTDKLQRILRWMRFNGCRDAAKEVPSLLGFRDSIDSGAFWQADHIVECVRGGWGTGLDNLRTLCTPCHKAETKRLAGELAAERRRAKAQGVLFGSAGVA